MIVRREMLNLAALSKSLSKSLTSPDPLLVNMVNFVPTSYGLCGKMFYKFMAMWHMIIIRILLVCSIMKQDTVDLGLS